MALKWLKLSGLVLIMFIFGCTIDPMKDELTRPVKINIMISIKMPPYNGNSIYCTDENGFKYSFRFKSWGVGIHKMHFEGIRDVGEKIVFETDPEQELVLEAYNLNDNDPAQSYVPYNPLFDFEIPQGTYNTLKWDVDLKKILAGGFVDDSASLNTGLYVTGHCNNSSYPPDIPFVFTVPDSTLFSFMFYGDNYFSINSSYSLALIFDLHYAFDSPSWHFFQEVEITGDGLNRKVIISSEQNKDFYDFVLRRLKSSLMIHISTL